MEWTYNEPVSTDGETDSSDSDGSEQPVEGPVYRVVDEGAVANGNHESFAERHDGRGRHP